MNKLLTALIAGCAALAGCAMPMDESFFFNRNKPVWPQATIDTSFQRTVITVRQSDGNISRGIKLSSPTASGTVLFFQGNNESVDGEGAQRLWLFQRLNVNAIMLDRRGYGQTPGQPSMALISSDAIEAFDQIRAETTGFLVVHGFSLGTVLASRVAGKRKVDALVLEGTLSDYNDFIEVRLQQNKVWFYQPKISPELQSIDTKADLKNYAGPLWIVVGERDTDTPPELAKRLFNAVATQQKELTIIPRAEHDVLNAPPGNASYKAFLSRVLPPEGPQLPVTAKSDANDVD